MVFAVAALAVVLVLGAPASVAVLGGEGLAAGGVLGAGRVSDQVAAARAAEGPAAPRGGLRGMFNRLRGSSRSQPKARLTPEEAGQRAADVQTDVNQANRILALSLAVPLRAAGRNSYRELKEGEKGGWGEVAPPFGASGFDVSGRYVGGDGKAQWLPRGGKLLKPGEEVKRPKDEFKDPANHGKDTATFLVTLKGLDAIEKSLVDQSRALAVRRATIAKMREERVNPPRSSQGWLGRLFNRKED